MSDVSLAFGKAVFPLTSITVSSFVVAGPFTRVLASKKLDRRNSPHYNPAGRHSIEGGMSTEHLDAPDGTVICMQIQKKNSGKAMADAAIFVRTRETGPLISLVAEMPNYHGSLLGNNFCVFMGRADIVTAKDLAAIGIDIPKNYERGFMDEEEVEECFTRTVVAPETARAPRYEVVEAEDGEKVVLQADTRVRRMRVRRP